MGRKNKERAIDLEEGGREGGAKEFAKEYAKNLSSFKSQGYNKHNTSQVGAPTGVKIVGVKYDANWQGYMNDDDMWQGLLDDGVSNRKLLRSFQIPAEGLCSLCCILCSLPPCAIYPSCARTGSCPCRKKQAPKCRQPGTWCYQCDTPRCWFEKCIEGPVVSIYTDQIEKVEQECYCVFPYIFCCKRIDTAVESIWEPGVLTNAQVMTLHEEGDTCRTKGKSTFAIVPSEASGGEPLEFEVSGPIEDRRRLYVELEKVMLQLRTCLENKVPAWRAQQGIGMKKRDVMQSGAVATKKWKDENGMNSGRE